MSKDDGRQPCQGRRDGRYGILAGRRVATELGGVGSIAVRVEVAKQLFPYKHQQPVPESFDLDESERNLETSILDFTPEEQNKLQLELQSRRRWSVEGLLVQDRTIRAADCERRIGTAGGNTFCKRCQALDQDESLQRELRRV